MFKDLCMQYQVERLRNIDCSADAGIGDPEQSIEEIIKEFNFTFRFQWEGFTVVSSGERFAALWDNGGPCIEWLDPDLPTLAGPYSAGPGVRYAFVTLEPNLGVVATQADYEEQGPWVVQDAYDPSQGEPDLWAPRWGDYKSLLDRLTAEQEREVLALLQDL